MGNKLRTTSCCMLCTKNANLSSCWQLQCSTAKAGESQSRQTPAETAGSAKSGDKKRGGSAPTGLLSRLGILAGEVGVAFAGAGE